MAETYQDGTFSPMEHLLHPLQKREILILNAPTNSSNHPSLTVGALVAAAMGTQSG